jgi:hypothetical protein
MFTAAVMLLGLWGLGIVRVFSIGPFGNVFLLIGLMFLVLSLLDEGVGRRHTTVTPPQREP